MSTHTRTHTQTIIATSYDRDVDLFETGRVCAPFRVRSELRHAPPPHAAYAGWREPRACTSDSIALESFRRTTVVTRPIKRPPPGATL